MSNAERVYQALVDAALGPADGEGAQDFEHRSSADRYSLLCDVGLGQWATLIAPRSEYRAGWGSEQVKLVCAAAGAPERQS